MMPRLILLVVFGCLEFRRVTDWARSSIHGLVLVATLALCQSAIADVTSMDGVEIWRADGANAALSAARFHAWVAGSTLTTFDDKYSNPLGIRFKGPWVTSDEKTIVAGDPPILGRQYTYFVRSNPRLYVHRKFSYLTLQAPTGGLSFLAPKFTKGDATWNKDVLLVIQRYYLTGNSGSGLKFQPIVYAREPIFVADKKVYQWAEDSAVDGGFALFTSAPVSLSPFVDVGGGADLGVVDATSRTLHLKIYSPAEELDTAIESPTTANFKVTVSNESDAQGYYIRLTFDQSIGSQFTDFATQGVSNSVLNLVTRPYFTTQPSDQDVTVPAVAMFSVVAQASPAPTYQWQERQDSGAEWKALANTSPYSGALTSSLTISPTSASLTGRQFQCVVTNSAGSATSNIVTLTARGVSLLPINRGVGSLGGQNFGITVSSSAQWSSATSDTWISISSGSSGTSNGRISYTVNSNSSASPRSGKITVNGVEHAVIQEGFGTTQLTSQKYTLAAGSKHSLFIKDDGSLWGMGDNFHGQLGDGTSINRHAPIRIDGGVVSVAAGSRHTVYLKSDKSVWAMGNNSSGALGSGSGDAVRKPIQIASDAVAIAAGRERTYYLKSDGALWCSGWGSSGERGDGSTTWIQPSFVLISREVASISAQEKHTLFLKSDGSLWAVGDNTYGQLGDGTNNSTTNAVFVESNVVQVGPGTASGVSVYIKGDQSVWGMGSNLLGELGVPKSSEIYDMRLRPLNFAKDAKALAQGRSHTLYINKDNILFGTGRGDSGQLGTGSLANAYAPTPIADGVAALAAGDAHTLYLKSDGTIWAMGDNSSGQLGDNSTRIRQIPVLVDSTNPAAPTGSISVPTTSPSLAAAGGNNFTLPVSGVGAWNVTTDATWVAITSATSGLGDATILYAVAPNLSSAARSASISVEGRQYIISQLGSGTTGGATGGGGAPVTSPTPAINSVAAGGGTGQSITVVSTSGWSATSSSTWISITGGASGSGNGTITYDVTANATGSARTGTISVNGSIFTINQLAASTASATVTSPTPTTNSPPSAGASGQIITIVSSGSWSATSSASWLTITSGFSGSGNGAIIYDVAANTATSNRSGTITVSGNVFTINQIGSSATPGIGLSGNFSFGKVTVGTFTTASLTIRNTGNATLNVSGIHYPAGFSGNWTGVVAPGEFRDITVSFAPTAVAVYKGDITVESNKVSGISSIAVSGIGNIVDSNIPAQYLFSTIGKERLAHIQPVGLAIDKTGHIYVAGGSLSHTIEKIAPSGEVTTVAGNYGQPGSSDGIGTSARFNHPEAVAVDAAGNIYVADRLNHAIRKISNGGVVSTLAGSPGVAGWADGIGGAARFSHPYSLAVDNSGNIYVGDVGNRAIRKINSSGVVTTFIASQISKYPNGDTIYFAGPYGLTIDGSGSVYFISSAVGSGGVIFKSTNSGVVSTLAGAGEVGSSDGIGSTARFNFPQALAVDNLGNLFVSDSWNNTIRKISSGGAVTTIGGGDIYNYGLRDGVGRDSRFYYPVGIAADAVGMLYIADAYNRVIRRAEIYSPTPSIVAPSITSPPSSRSSVVGQSITLSVTAAGTPTPTYQWLRNGIPVPNASSATLTINSLKTTDSGGYSVVVTNSAGSAVSSAGTLTVTVGVAPNIVTPPASQVAILGQSVTFSVSASGTPSPTFQWLLNGNALAGASSASLTIDSTQSTDAGSYSVVVTNAAGSVTSPSGVLTVASSRLSNLSILTSIASAGDSFTLGYVVGGTGTSGSKQLVIRAVGPSLVPLGVPGTLDDPSMELFTGATKSGENDNWGGSLAITNAMASVGAFAYTGPTSGDAAIALAVGSGSNSVKVSAVGNGTGAVLAEIYDATSAASFTATTPRLVNVSVLKQLGAGFTAGFVVGGTGAKSVLVRAIGPTLGSAFGLPGVVGDPQLTLYSSQTAVASNDNWGGGATLASAFSSVGAFSLPAGSRDAAVVARLNPGNYTVQVSGVAGATGTILVEIYDLP
jgi:alpha-tubulin suppressor-like RCC1 family protein